MYADTVNLNTEIEKAYEGLRGIDNSIKSLTGRPPPPSERLGGRGRGRGGGIAARLGPAAGARASLGGERSDARDGATELPPSLLGRRRATFGNREDDSMFQKRPRRSAAGAGEFYAVDDDVPHNGPKPTLQSSVVMPAIETKSRDAAISELKSTEKTEQKSRNQRMFANLLVGTLNKFRKDEKKVSTVEKVQMQKQKEIEQRLEQTKRSERETVMKERNELMEQRRDKEKEIRKLQRKRAIVQYAEREQDHMRKLQNFIQTQAKPPIFYLPGKHTLRTLELLKNTAKRIEEQVTKRQEQLEKDLVAVESAPLREQRVRDAGEGGGAGAGKDGRLRSSVMESGLAGKSAADKERDSGRRRRNTDSEVEEESESETEGQDRDQEQEQEAEASDKEGEGQADGETETNEVGDGKDDDDEEEVGVTTNGARHAQVNDDDDAEDDSKDPDDAEEEMVGVGE